MTERINIKTQISKDLNKTIKLYSVEKEIGKERVIEMAIEEGMRSLLNQVEARLHF